MSVLQLFSAGCDQYLTGIVDDFNKAERSGETWT